MIPTHCWACDALLTRAEQEDWWQRFTTGRTSHGPYCTDHEPKREGESFDGDQ